MCSLCCAVTHVAMPHVCVVTCLVQVHARAHCTARFVCVRVRACFCVHWGRVHACLLAFNRRSDSKKDAHSQNVKSALDKAQRASAAHAPNTHALASASVQCTLAHTRHVPRH